MTHSAVDLSQPLPYTSRFRWGYQHYPVFSYRWWRGRALVFGLGALVFTGLTGAGALTEFDSALAALRMTLIFMLGVLGMILTGPTLATLARSIVREGVLQQSFVTAGFVLGMVAAGLCDGWSSREIEQSFLTHSTRSKELIAASLAEPPGMTLQLIDVTVGVMLYFWLAGGIAFIRYWREPGQLRTHQSALDLRAARAEQHAAQARLSMLQAQIEPHFLFNTLASVKSVLRDEPDLAEETIDHLVDYLRSAVPRFNDAHNPPASTVAQQVVLCEKYLAIMRLRMGDRLSYDTQIDDAVSELAFPPLVILSLVENAIKHGIEPTSADGHVAVQAELQEGRLVIHVSDTGVGLSGGASSRISSGLGLKNALDQLRLLYGDDAQLELSENRSGGTTATLRVTIPA